MNDPFLPDDETAAIELIEGGSEIAGAAAGAAIGLVGGPPGVVVGSAAGVVVTRGLKWVGAEISRRWLAPRQRMRVGAGLAFAADRIRGRLEAGDQVRADGFFDVHPDRRSSAEELLEGVLIQVGNSYEEDRIKYVANLYASVVFEEIGGPYANYLLRISERLSFRQLVCMALLSDGIGQDILLPAGAPMADAYCFSEEVAFELDELATLGLAGIGQPGGGVVDPRTGRYGTSAGFRSVVVGDAVLSTQGRLLAKLMELKTIPEPARLGVLRHLWALHQPE